MKTRLLTTIAFLTTVVGFQSAQAAELSLTPSTWGTLTDGGSEEIDGVVDFISVEDEVIAGYSSTAPEEFQGNLEFGVIEFTVQSMTFIESAFLNLLNYDDSGSSESLPFQLYGYIGDGQITASDFLAGNLLADFTLDFTGNPESVAIDVTDYVSQVVAAGNEVVGFNIRPDGNPQENNTAYFFSSPAAGPGSSTLDIEAQPIPEPLTILGTGTALALGAAFKRKLAQKQTTSRSK
ncbi:MAG: PEP-CTERM sorting domain-containing protein [Cyanophyceae cyanobacterium]